MCIGLSTDEEREIGRRIGTADALGFFALAQRVTWGLSQPDLVEVDVEAALGALLREHGDSWAAHLVAAAVLRGSDPLRAEVERARAIDLVADDSRAHRLLPDDATWAGAVQEQTLEEVVPDTVWRVRRDFPSVGLPFTNASVATLLRIDENALALVNPVAFDPGVHARVDALGEVRWLLTQGPGHSRYVEGATKAFPNATNWGVAGHRAHPASAHVRFDGMLDGDRRGLPDALQTFDVVGTQLPETLILHRPSRLLVAQDLVAHNADNDARPFFSRLYSLAFGLIDRIGFHAYQPPLWSDLNVMHAAIDRILASDFEYVTGAHWPIAPEHPDAFRAALAWLRRLSPLSHKMLLARYFWAQPTFLRDLLRYKRRRRQLAR
jgi:hypothetical protein